MKKLVLAAALTAAAATAHAGSLADPVIEAPVIVEEATGSSGGVLLPLLLSRAGNAGHSTKTKIPNLQRENEAQDVSLQRSGAVSKLSVGRRCRTVTSHENCVEKLLGCGRSVGRCIG